jgi:hypothetical protein
MQASSRSGLGSAGIANIRSARALSMLLDPNIIQDPYAFNLVNTDIQGIMKGGAPDEVQLKEGYKNLQTWLGSLWQKVSSQPAMITQPEVQAQLINILTGLQDIDNQIIDKNLGVQKVVFKKILAEDPERAMEYFAALQETMANPTGGFGSNPPMKKKDTHAGTEKPGEEIGGLPVMKNRAEVEKLKSGTVFLFNGVKHTKK